MNEQETVRRRPKMKAISGYPIWCHNHCDKMKVEKFDKKNHLLIIAGSAARITITPGSVTVGEEWFVEHEVEHSWGSARGRVIFQSADLRAAFGFTDDYKGHSKWLIEQFGADSAKQGKYIRWENFLNILCPGTGNDGDPNVSIYINEEIQDAVRQLLE